MVRENSPNLEFVNEEGEYEVEEAHDEERGGDTGVGEADDEDHEHSRVHIPVIKPGAFKGSTNNHQIVQPTNNLHTIKSRFNPKPLSFSLGKFALLCTLLSKPQLQKNKPHIPYPKSNENSK